MILVVAIGACAGVTVSVNSGTVSEEREFGEYCEVAIGASADVAGSVDTGPVSIG